MKSLSVEEAQRQLGKLIADAYQGEAIVITDGDRKVMLSVEMPMDLEEDSAELAAEVLKAVKGPHSPYSSEEMRAACERIVREKHG